MNLLNRSMLLATGIAVFASLQSTSSFANDGLWLAKLFVREGGPMCLMMQPVTIQFRIRNGNIGGSGFADGARWNYSGNLNGNSLTVFAISSGGNTLNATGGLHGNTGGGGWQSSAGCSGNASFRRIGN